MKHKDRIINIKLHPTQIIVIGFAIVILVGAILLLLPIATKNGESAGIIDALFTSTSAVCVTGLVVRDTGTYWSSFGQVVILLLIQIGGLGFMTVGTLFAFAIRKKITFRERLIMQEALNQFKLSGIVRITKNILIVTFSIETIGALFLSIKFIPIYGVKDGILFSFFHSISAFCNAGFDIVGNFKSLTPFVNDALINLVVILLIILGGLGFTVIMELLQKRNFSKLSLHSKMVLKITFILILIGFIGIFVLEYSNPFTLGQYDFKDKILPSLFHGVTPRTAGFNTLDTGKLTTASVFLTIVLMFIGGSSGSTAGGVKTTTIGVTIMMIYAIIRGKEDTEAYGKKIPMEIIKKSVAIIGLAMGLIIIVTMILSITEVDHSFKEILFEAVSAFGTVGLSLGITSSLTNFGKIIISLTMFFGRVGPLTIFLALAYRRGNVKRLVRYPEEKVIVG